MQVAPGRQDQFLRKLILTDMNYFEKPFTRETVHALIETRQRFTDVNCHGSRCHYFEMLPEHNGKQYVSLVTEYRNGMHPGTSMLIEDAVNYLNSAVRLEFQSIYYLL